MKCILSQFSCEDAFVLPIFGYYFMSAFTPLWFSLLGAGERLPVCVWHDAISVSKLSLQRLPSLKTFKTSEIFGSPYGGLSSHMCGLAARQPFRCAFAAITKMPSHNRWRLLPGHLFLALSKQTNPD